jgi:uroporphyrin-III C-methyltransferase/precorrin-2 dehydrogenase/sirohydrochlorin ferrochelatase/precorrin-2 dehydrogenase/sirohydrochlorin ferrochelatase
LNFRFPVFLDLTGKNCLVTGAGYEVPAKVQALVDASANVTYINPSAEPPIESLAVAGLIRWHARAFEPGDLRERFLVITDHEDNSEIFRMAEEQRVLCNAVDDPSHCRFSFGSIHRQGELAMAISTNGWAPAVAVRLKEWLQREIGPEYAVFLDLLKKVRPEITTRIGDFAARRALWYRIVDSEALALLRNNQIGAAEGLIRSMIEETVSNTSGSDTSPDAGGQ